MDDKARSRGYGSGGVGQRLHSFRVMLVGSEKHLHNRSLVKIFKALYRSWKNGLDQ